MTLRQAVERYGLALGVVLALVVTLVVLPSNTQNTTNRTTAEAGAGSLASGGGGTANAAGDAGGQAGAGVDASGGSGASTGGGTGQAAGGTGGGGTAGAAGAASGPQVTFGKGPHCRGDGRQLGVSYAMPPCAQWNATDNGGATGRGVFPDRILVVRYLAQIDPGTRAILQGTKLSDDPAVVKRAYDALRRYGNMHYETYGREVQFVDYPASGPHTSDEASRADAIKIAGDIKPFAVIEGDPAGAAPATFITELARRGVPCFCSTSLPSSVYTSVPPIVFSALPTMDEYVQASAEYTCKKLLNKKADYAGAGVKGKDRKYGLIYWQGENGTVYPWLAATKPLAEQAFARCGIKFTKEVGYFYDPGRNQQDVTNLIAQLKGAGVTTIFPFWDPLYPILITQEATKQAYFPEWFVTGTGLSDTTTAGRLYDQQQWTHAFGVSPLWVTWATVAKSAGYREYHWARPDDPPGDEGVLINIYRARIAELFTSIHMAGPRLTNDTLTAGVFAYPPTGGSAGRPLLFRNRQYPNAIKDFVEVWYDGNASGPDERGQQGNGMIRKADGGRRFRIGQFTNDPSKWGVTAGSLTVSDDPPGGGEWPSDSDPRGYPPTKRCLSCP